MAALTRVVAVELLKRRIRIETPIELGNVQGVLLSLQLRIVQGACVPQLPLAVPSASDAHTTLRPMGLSVWCERRLQMMQMRVGVGMGMGMLLAWMMLLLMLMMLLVLLLQLTMPVVIYASASCAMAAGGQIEM